MKQGKLIQAALVICGLFVFEFVYLHTHIGIIGQILYADFRVKNWLFICEFRIRSPKWRIASTSNNEGKLVLKIKRQGFEPRVLQMVVLSAISVILPSSNQAPKIFELVFAFSEGPIRMEDSTSSEAHLVSITAVWRQFQKARLF